jgi:hypothetical protein
MIMVAPVLFAQTISNTDFNPFPQMEQDQNAMDEQMAPKPQEYNEDAWPPPGAGNTQENNEQ